MGEGEINAGQRIVPGEVPEMKVGLLLGGEDNRWRAEAQMAEGAGFDYAACGEHLFFHGPTPNSFITLAAVAGATERIRLLSSISLVPLYPSALFAKLVASLDRVSSGRYELGVGAGGENAAEFEAVGVDLSSRFRRVEETLEVCRLLFAGGPVHFDGEFTRLDGVELRPTTLQRRMPPLWLAGRKPQAIERVGRLADVWLPYMVTPEALRAGLATVRDVATSCGRDTHSVSAAIFAWVCADGDGQWARKTGIEEVGAGYAQDFERLADRYLFLGTPSRVLARFAEFADAGADRAIVSIAAPKEDRDRVLQTFVSDVLPGLAAL